jgi:hypothetical protein
MAKTFKYEYQMVKPAEKWLSSQGLTTKTEFPTPWGICDLVGCSLIKKKIKQRIRLGQINPIGSQLRVMILSEIPDEKEGESIAIGELLKRFTPQFLNKDRVSLELDRLKKDRFVQITPNGEFQKRNGWIPLHKRIVALELKLTRIKDALHQATCNLEFASESYVGVPIQIAQHLETKRISDFVEKGIGLVGISRNECKVFVKPNTAKSHHSDIAQIHCVERFWRTYIRGN